MMFTVLLLIINSHQLVAVDVDYYEERIDIDFNDIMSPINNFADEKT